MCKLCEKGLATPWDARCRDFKEVMSREAVGQGPDRHEPAADVRTSASSAAPKQRWSREAYNEYMREYMARRRAKDVG